MVIKTLLIGSDAGFFRTTITHSDSPNEGGDEIIRIEKFMLLSISQLLLIICGAFLLLHWIAGIFQLSRKARSVWLFGRSPWLPRYQYPPIPDTEPVEFSTPDLFTLRGSIISSRLPYCNGVVLFCHELNSDRWSVTPWIESLTAQGYTIITFDQRNHGESDSDRKYQSTPWISEIDVQDVRAALRYISRRFPQNTPVTLMGVNKGGLTALGAAASGDDLPINSVVIDCNRFTPQWQPDGAGKASVFSLSYLFCRIKEALIGRWRRRILGVWCGCRFVNLRRLVGRVQQPVLWIGNDLPEPNLRFDEAEQLEPHHMVLDFLETNRPSPTSQPIPSQQTVANVGLKIANPVRS